MLEICCLALFESCIREPFTYEDSEFDLKPPKIFILSPTSSISYNSANDRITVSGIATDNEGISRIEWRNNNGSTSIANGQAEWEISNIQLSSGDNVLTFIAYDTSENKDSVVLVVTYNKYFTFLGCPIINPNSFYVNTNIDVNIRVSILANPNLITNSIKLIEVNYKGEELNEVCEMFDDGNLLHGDDIKGDGIYSNIHNFNETNETKIYLRIKATSQESIGKVDAYSEINTIYIVEKLPQSVSQAIISAQEIGYSMFIQLIATYTYNEAIEKTINFLEEQEYVLDASLTGSGDIWIEFEYGLTGMIILNEEGNEGGSTYDQGRSKSVKIPVHMQTRGTFNDVIEITKSDNNLVLNKSALLFAPNYDQFVSWGTEFLDSVNNILEISQCPNFTIDYVKNSSADLSVLRDLDKYGLVVIHTHGGLDQNDNVVFISGDEYDSDDENLLDWKAGRIFPSSLQGKSVWGVKPSFIDEYNEAYPNSIIYNGSCESGHNRTMANAFLNNGASTYYGFSETVKSVFDRDMAYQLFPKLISLGESTGESFVEDQHDTNDPPAYFVMFGETDTYFSADFMNGGFEEGNLTGWLKDGDGRVITQLGFISPYSGNFMGIISTGLGYTVETGSISQSVCIPDGASNLSIYWNFVSEEFIEYVGSIYQDYFDITITDEYGTENSLFHKTIDDIYSEYDLISISPDIVFDQGDVYFTDWQCISINISQYAGSNVTLTLRSGDVGDSIFDTAILLDQIEIK